MEILRKGVLPADRRYVKTCPNCQTMFRFKQAETMPSGSTDQRDFNTRMIRCPLQGCDNNMVVGPRDLEQPEVTGMSLLRPR